MSSGPSSRPAWTSAPRLLARLPGLPLSQLIVVAVLLLSVLAPGVHAQRDPVANFCRRFGHQTAVVDSRLYIDGGLLGWNPIGQTPNETSM